MASKSRNMFYQNKKQETTEIGTEGIVVLDFHIEELNIPPDDVITGLSDGNFDVWVTDLGYSSMTTLFKIGFSSTKWDTEDNMSRGLIALLFLSVLAVAPRADGQILASTMLLLPSLLSFVNTYIRSIGTSYIAQGTITVNQVIPTNTIITSAIVRLAGTTLGLLLPIQVNLCTFLNSTGVIYSLNSSVPITCPVQPGTYGVNYTLPVNSALQTTIRTALQLPLLLLGSTLSCIQTVLILQSGNVTVPTPPISIQPATGIVGCILPILIG
ncbi:hypothetical protein AAG570_012376 [Ranatra chinensis]|uniref:Uncharacterized protein n=1 Tax=Ranatra chinensis TaxID=642074 RepID=A0ABD0YIZ5_9HEMI